MAEFQQLDLGRLILGLLEHGLLLSISVTIVVVDSRGQNQQVQSFLLLQYSKYANCVPRLLYMQIFVCLWIHICVWILSVCGYIFTDAVSKRSEANQ